MHKLKLKSPNDNFNSNGEKIHDSLYTPNSDSNGVKEIMNDDSNGDMKR